MQADPELCFDVFGNLLDQPPHHVAFCRFKGLLTCGSSKPHLHSHITFSSLEPAVPKLSHEDLSASGNGAILYSAL